MKVGFPPVLDPSKVGEYPAVAAMIEEGDLGAIRAHMNAGRGPGCHTMNSVLEALLAAHVVGVDEARAATTDRIGFAEMV